MRIDIISLCEQNNIPFLTGGHHHCTEGWVQLHCPFCPESKGWHLGFHIETGAFNCWKCGKHKTREVIQALTRGTRLSAAALLRNYTSNAPVARAIQTRPRRVTPPPHMGPLKSQQIKYLEQRGFDAAQLEEEWGIKGCSHLSGEWAWRIVIPIRDVTGRVVAYQGRTIRDEVKPKYRMTAKNKIPVNPRSLIYGIDKIKKDKVIIVEGCTGCWKLGAGNAVATLGIDWSMEQANQLRKIQHRYILFDPEKQAQEQADKLANFLSTFPGTTTVLSGFCTDPGEFSRRLVKKVLHKLGFER